MSDVFYLRPTGTAVTESDVVAMASTAGGCFKLHRVSWNRSFLALDGSRMMCCYRGPDAESARLALRELGSDMNAIWSGCVYPAHDALFDDNIDTLVEVKTARRSGDIWSVMDRVLPQGQMVAVIESLDGSTAVGLYHQGAGLNQAHSASDPEVFTSMNLWQCQGITPPRS